MRRVTSGLCLENMPGTMALLLILAMAASAQSPQYRIKQPKKEKEPETQTLPLPPEPPAAVIADTGKLSFHLSPLSGKGLLTQQVRDALKALDRASNGATVVKLRAFVAGTGDMRRVATIVGEEFSDRKISPPALTTIQVGALALEGAQVVIESINAEKKTVNPNGLVFFSGQKAATVDQTVTQVARAAKDQDALMLQVTCFLTDLNQADSARKAIAAAFPAAAANFVQSTRLAVEPETSCEGIGRAQTPGPGQNHDRSVRVNTPKVVFTGSQMAFRDGEADLRLAYGRLGRALDSVHTGFPGSLVVNVYALNKATGDRAAALAKEFLGRPAPPAGTMQVVEGLPSSDASVAIEVVAAGP
jgi:enamine deaminase RidA (YjgF/YER057c/UK114 family)